MHDKELIYDVGANDGADTAYYLRRGYRVIAIEADPSLAKKLRERRSMEIAAGRLMVLNIAVTEKDREQVTFYLSRDDSKSSLIKEMSERDGVNIDSVEVTGRSLGSLFDEFGVPFYCKMDIEGYDAKAIAGLTGYKGRPPHISCESTGKSIGKVYPDNDGLYQVLDALVSAGYTRFKLVDQDSLHILSDQDHYRSLHKWTTRIRTKLERWTGLLSPRYNNKLYQLKKGLLEGDYATGAFGTSLAGEWSDYDTTKKYLARHFRDYFEHTQNKELVFWVDIHATY